VHFTLHFSRGLSARVNMRIALSGVCSLMCLAVSGKVPSQMVALMFSMLPMHGQAAEMLHLYMIGCWWERRKKVEIPPAAAAGCSPSNLCWCSLRFHVFIFLRRYPSDNPRGSYIGVFRSKKVGSRKNQVNWTINGKKRAGGAPQLGTLPGLFWASRPSR
jgi:hypothetical protein